MDDKSLEESAAEVGMRIGFEHPQSSAIGIILAAFKQVRSEVEEETRRKTAVEAWKWVARKNEIGGLRVYKEKFGLTDTDFAAAEETNGTSQAGKSTLGQL